MTDWLTVRSALVMLVTLSLRRQYEVPCHEVRSAIINSSSMDILLPSSSFTVSSLPTPAPEHG